MKRFHSNLQKVHDLCLQQSRMAELAFSHAKSQWIVAQQEVEKAMRQQEMAQAEVNSALKRSRQSIAILGMQQHLNIAAERIQSAQQASRKAEEHCEQARQKYQELHSQVERLQRLIERQREEHRSDMFKEQQRTMDDVAISRWTAPEHLGNEVIRHG